MKSAVVNLRGRKVLFLLEGRTKPLKGVVVTRTRGTRWLIESSQLPDQCRRGLTAWSPKRISLDRAEFELVEP